jgi:tRNA pseudouridine38-40 synthase
MEADGPAEVDAPRLRARVAYDGTPFRGFAAQPEVPTVAGTLVAAIERVTGHRVELTCAGRTDAGVHARGQVISFDLPAPRAPRSTRHRAVAAGGGSGAPPRDGAGWDLDRLARSVNRLCGPEVVLRDLEVAPAGFDARHDATGRAYRYTVLNRPVPDPFLDRWSWHVTEPLDLRAMVAACDPLVGEHDFSSFCRAPKVRPGTPVPSLVRRVERATWVDRGGGVLEFHVEASAFCHQMVRSIVGTLVEVGRGRRTAADVMAVRNARDRAVAGQMAPARGLCLWAVRYGPAPGPATGPIGGR